MQVDDESHVDEALVRERAELAPLLDTCRAITLMMPLAVEFNDIPVVSPAKRMVLVGRVINQAVDQNERLLDLVRESGAVQVLREALMRRQNDPLACGAAFLADIDSPTEREGAR